jgi:hypothetical protein
MVGMAERNKSDWLHEMPELYRVDRHERRDGGKMVKINDTLRILHSLLNRPFWRRVWIVQEFILAQNLSLMCGTAVMEVQEGFPKCYKHSTKSIPSVRSFGHIKFGFSRKSWTFRLNAATWRSALKNSVPYEDRTKAFLERESGLLNALAHTQHCEATDPRDKIYGLLGIVDWISYLIMMRIPLLVKYIPKSLDVV